MGTTISTTVAYGFPLTEELVEEIDERMYPNGEDGIDERLWVILKKYPLLESELSYYHDYFHEPFVAVKASIQTEYDCGWNKIDTSEHEEAPGFGPEPVVQLHAIAEELGITGKIVIGWYRSVSVG